MVVGPIKNAGVSFTLLQKAGKSIKFISNNSYRSDSDYIKKFSSIGIQNVQPKDLIHPDKTILTYLKSNPKYKHICAISGPILKENLISNGFTIDKVRIYIFQQYIYIIKSINFQPDKKDEFTLQSFTQSIIPSTPVDALIIDFDLELSLAKFCRGLLFANNFPDCDIIVGAADNKIPLAENVVIPGIEALIKYIEISSGKKSVILGKPGKELGNHIIKLYNISCPEKCLFIGDNLLMDIGFANSLGFQTLFVLSGAHSYEDMMKASNENKPDYFADSVGDLINFFEDLN